MAATITAKLKRAIKGQLVRDDRGEQPRIYVIQSISDGIAEMEEAHGIEDLVRLGAKENSQVAHWLRK